MSSVYTGKQPQHSSYPMTTGVSVPGVEAKGMIIFS